MDNKILETILRKMCEIGGNNFDDFKWFNNDDHLKVMWKRPEAESEFVEWLTEYIRGLKMADLRKITDYPYVYYRKKKMSQKFANNFVFNYGFKTYSEDIITIRKKKLKNIMDNNEDIT